MMPMVSLAGSHAAVNPAERWLLVDTANAALLVLQGESVVARFQGIAVGRGGVRPVHYRGDKSTPSGEYRIVSINRKSDYTLFFGLNYPTPAHAMKAMEEGRLSRDELNSIVVADWAGDPPPENTALGGRIGIHGIGRGSLEVHRKFNWTEGCVALDNQQILALANFVRLGMRVVIKEGEVASATPPP